MDLTPEEWFIVEPPEITALCFNCAEWFDEKYAVFAFRGVEEIFLCPKCAKELTPTEFSRSLKELARAYTSTADVLENLAEELASKLTWVE